MVQMPSDRSGLDILPTNKVLTFVETQETLERLIAALQRTGIDAEDIFVHHGEQGKQYIDADGTRHGFVARMLRSYQRLSGMEARLLQDADAALNAGYYLVGVQTTGQEAEREQVVAVTQQFTSYRIYFCGRSTIRIMANWEQSPESG